jgi:hypothetical protein
MDEHLTYEEISQAFIAYLADSDIEGLRYGDFWRILDDRGAKIKGRNGKVQRDRVYRALTLDPRLVKAKPGFFSLAADESTPD